MIENFRCSFLLYSPSKKFSTGPGYCEDLRDDGRVRYNEGNGRSHIKNKKNIHMQNSKNVEAMDRIEVIDELRSHAHPSCFHSLLLWTTPRLKALLVYYREDAKEGAEKKEIGSPLKMFGSITNIEINFQR